MECERCNHELPDDAQVCLNCGAKIVDGEGKSWHSLHNLLWDSKINQDILETLNELKQKRHLIDTTRN